MSDDFDPKAYLKSTENFDPKAYLHATASMQGSPETGYSNAAQLPPAPVGQRYTPETGVGTAALKGAAQGFTGGFGDEITGGIQAAGMKYLPESLGGDSQSASKPFFSLYKQQRDVSRQEDDKAVKDQPGAYYSSELASSLPGLVGTAGGAASVEGALAAGGINASKLPGAVGLTQAALMSAGSSKNSPIDTPEERKKFFKDVAVDTAIAGAFPVVAKLAGVTASKIGSLAKTGYRFITPDPAAEELMAHGIPLTLGRMNPKGSINAVEESVQHAQPFGTDVEKARNASNDAFEHAYLDQTRAPGAKPIPANVPLDEKAKVLQSGWNSAYGDALKNQKVTFKISTMKPVIQAAQAADEAIDASEASRTQVRNFIDNQLSILRPKNGAISAEQVQKVRSNIRYAARAREMSQNPEDKAMAQLYRNFEDSMTGLLNDGLPPEKAQLLSTLDSRYNEHVQAMDLIAKARFGKQFFTPSDALRGADASATRALTAPEELATAGKKIFETRAPPTAVRAMAVAPGAKFLSGLALSKINNDPALIQSLIKQRQIPLAGLMSLLPESSPTTTMLRRGLGTAGGGLAANGLSNYASAPPQPYYYTPH